MMSRLTTDELRTLYPQEDLTGLTQGSITSRTALEQALESIRDTGYATSREESEDGVMSVAVAISSPSGELFGMNVSVPAHRMSDKRRAELGALLQAAAGKLHGMLV